MAECGRDNTKELEEQEKRDGSVRFEVVVGCPGKSRGCYKGLATAEQSN